jgi:hypothetical protein
VHPHYRAMYAAIARRPMSLLRRHSACALLGALFASVTSTTSAGQVPVGPPPADPGARVPGVEYRSTIAPFVSRRPVGPGPWRQQNDRVAPEPKAAPNPTPRSDQSEPSR